MKLLSSHYDSSGFLSVTIKHYKEYKLPTFHANGIGIPHIEFKGETIALKDIKRCKNHYTTHSGL